MYFIHQKLLNLMNSASRLAVSPCHQTLTYSRVIWLWRNHFSKHAKRHIDCKYAITDRGYATQSAIALQRSLLSWKRYTRSKAALTCPQQRHSAFSSLFVSDKETTFSNFEFDPGFEELLENLNKLKRNLQKRGNTADVEAIVNDFTEFRRLREEKQTLEQKREAIAQQIAAIVKHQKTKPVKSSEVANKLKKLKEEGKDAKEKLKTIMSEFWEVEERLMLTALNLPNNTLDTVTSEEKVMEEIFKDKRLLDQVDHMKILEDSKYVKLSNVGAKAYYLMGRLAVLEQELIENFSTQLTDSGFTFVLASELFKTAVVEGSGLDVLNPSSTYRLQSKQGSSVSDFDQEHMFLIGCSHLSFNAYMARMIVQSDSLPLKYFAVGRNYRPEHDVTSHLPGLLGCLQSVKVCMAGFCKTHEDCVEMMYELQEVIRNIYTQLNLPFRFVSMPAQSLQPWEQNRIELQLWVPSLQDYLQVGLVSVHGDYSSRRLMMRYREHQHSVTKPLHMVYAEAVDITKLLAVILENKLTDKHWGIKFGA